MMPRKLKKLLTTVILVQNLALTMVALAGLSGCAEKYQPSFPPEPGDQSVVIHVAAYGGHSGIILPGNAIPDDLRRLITRFRDSRYIEFGWGDADYYRNPEISAFVAVKAALWPTASVLHLIGIDEDMEEYAAVADIYRIELGREGFLALCTFIGATFSRDETGNSIPLGPDPVYNRLTHFYQARPKFFFPRTCNTWTAAALQKAGVPISPWANIFVKNIAGNMAVHGTRISPAARDQD